MKKFASFLLCLVMILSLLPADMIQTRVEAAETVKYAVEGGNLYFDPSTGTITRCDDTVTSAAIPTSISGVPVKVIGENAFAFCTKMKSVTIPYGVTTIAPKAFWACYLLTGLTLPITVTTIGEKAFCDCKILLSMTIPDNVTSIGNLAFWGCNNLKTVTLPNNLKTMGDQVFWECWRLKSITIPGSLKKISDYTFRNCYDLANVTIGNGVVDIGKSAFDDCYGLVSVSIPDTVKTIGDYAFYGCSALENITIPDKVTSIGTLAFYNCRSLKSVTIPDSVTTLGSSAFLDCKNLATVKIGTGLSTIETSAFSGCGVRTLTIPSTVKSIGGGAFSALYAYAHVYYSGTEKQWKDIDISYNNNQLKGSTINIHYNWIFGDVTIDDYFADPVQWAVGKGITTGTSATKFSPDKACTRGQIVTFLWRAAGSPAPKTTANPFSDIQEKDYYYNAVLWAVEEGITSGTGKGKFSPNNECTRAQVATFLWRFQGQPAPASTTNTFSDVAQGAYYYEAVLWAVEQGITNGTGKGKFSPDNSCTRGQIVTFLYRTLA